jgi:hypothetical protein
LRSVSPRARSWNKGRTHFVYLSSQFSPVRAAYIRSGWRDQSSCTVCRNAVRIRILDTVREARKRQLAAYRIGRSAKPHAYRAFEWRAARRCPSGQVFPQTVFPVLFRCLDIRADDTSGRTKALSWDHACKGILSRFTGWRTSRSRIVFPQCGCYHPSVAIIAGGHLCLTEMETDSCGF